jgi:hypothetical protein
MASYPVMVLFWTGAALSQAERPPRAIGGRCTGRGEGGRGSVRVLPQEDCSPNGAAPRRLLSDDLLTPAFTGQSELSQIA